MAFSDLESVPGRASAPTSASAPARTLTPPVTVRLASLISSTSPPRSPTQTTPEAGSTARLAGSVPGPVRMVATTAWRASLISDTAPESESATHTVPVRGSAAMPNGAVPTLKDASTFPFASLISSTRPPTAGRPKGPRQVTHTVTVFLFSQTSTGLTPTLITATTTRRCAEISDRVLSRLFTTQTMPLTWSTATDVGSPPTAIVTMLPDSAVTLPGTLRTPVPSGQKVPSGQTVPPPTPGAAWM